MGTDNNTCGWGMWVVCVRGDMAIRHERYEGDIKGERSEVLLLGMHTNEVNTCFKL